MAIKQYAYVITTTRQALTIPDDDLGDGATVWLYGEFHGSSEKIAIGGSDVTAATGLHIYGGEKFGPIRLGHAETIYAIATGGSLELRMLVQGA